MQSLFLHCNMFLITKEIPFTYFNVHIRCTRKNLRYSRQEQLFRPLYNIQNYHYEVTQVDIYQKLAFLWVYSTDSCVIKCQPLCNISQQLILAVYPVLSITGTCWAHAESLDILWGSNIAFVRTHSRSLCAKREIAAEKQNNIWTF